MPKRNEGRSDARTPHTSWCARRPECVADGTQRHEASPAIRPTAPRVRPFGGSRRKTTRSESVLCMTVSPCTRTVGSRIESLTGIRLAIGAQSHPVARRAVVRRPRDETCGSVTRAADQMRVTQTPTSSDACAAPVKLPATGGRPSGSNPVPTAIWSKPTPRALEGSNPHHPWLGR